MRKGEIIRTPDGLLRIVPYRFLSADFRMANLKTIKLPVSANIKLTLVALAFLIVAGTLYYTNRLANEMKESERKTVRLYTSILSKSLNTPQSPPEPGEHSPEDYASEIAFDLGNTIDFPIIFTNPDKTIETELDPVTKKPVRVNMLMRNVSYDTTAPVEEQIEEVKGRIEQMASLYPPYPIYTVIGRDSTIAGYFFYDDSDVVKQVQLLPIVGMIIIAMFIFVGYISFSHIKRNEQSNIWVGMAKETAHQLGTPLSSLLGWIELLRYMPEDTEQVLEAAGEMQRDVERLNKIALRFSKIGSAAEVKPVELNAVLRNVVAYFERRLPHLGKKVTLSLIESPAPVHVAINTDLFEWVFENLVRNAADAIDHADGEIRMEVHAVRGQALIDVIDNGRGIDPKIRKDIFRPGFSTKQRGWGLGLSLAKRIVEDYHGGKIMIKQSSSAGTTFRIRVPATEAPANGVAATEPTVVGRVDSR